MSYVTHYTISGPLLFGLQLDSVRKARESRKRGYLIKPALVCSSSTLVKRAKKIAAKIKSSFNSSIKETYHQSDQVILENVEFSVNANDYFQVNFGSENEVDNAHKLQSIVKSIDQGQISRDFYRNLAAAEIHLPRENSVSNERIAITNHMNQLIKISLVNMNGQNESEEIMEVNEPDFTNSEIT